MVKSLPFVDTVTRWPVCASSATRRDAGATHVTEVALRHTPLVVIVPILHRNRLVFAKFHPSTRTTVPPAVLPERGDTCRVAGTGAYVNSTALFARAKLSRSPLDTSTATAPSRVPWNGASHFINTDETKWVVDDAYPLGCSASLFVPALSCPPSNQQTLHGLKCWPKTSSADPVWPYLGVNPVTLP